MIKCNITLHTKQGDAIITTGSVLRYDVVFPFTEGFFKGRLFTFKNQTLAEGGTDYLPDLKEYSPSFKIHLASEDYNTLTPSVIEDKIVSFLNDLCGENSFEKIV